VFNGATVTLTSCTLSDNSVSTNAKAQSAEGGGVDNTGTAILTNCTISDNSASNHQQRVSTALGGDGGGVFNAGTATLTNCTISDNAANNDATTGVNKGGGVDNAGTVTLTNCTISGNSAVNNDAWYAYEYGGGVFTGGQATLTNCTITGNSAVNHLGNKVDVKGGGVFLGGKATLTNCTISGNSVVNNSVYYHNVTNGSGMYNVGTYYHGPMTLVNTIVAGNTTGGLVVGGVGDVIGNLAAGSSNNLIGGNPLLAPLGENGGPTQTMALLPGGPAIDAVTSGANIPLTDERGLSRDGNTDIGAFESQGFTLTPVAGSTPQSSNIGTAFAPLALSVTANNSKEPVNGGIVQFTVNPASNGATAIVDATSAVIANGQAAIGATPNNTLGSYTVVASTTGAAPVSFELTNTGSVLTTLVVNTTSDSLSPGAGLLSLRDAVALANNDGGQARPLPSTRPFLPAPRRSL
jgi:hypothetical protein